MAPLVDHKTANCRGEQETKRQCLDKEDKKRDKDRNINIRRRKNREMERYASNSMSLLSSGQPDSGYRQLINCPD